MNALVSVLAWPEDGGRERRNLSETRLRSGPPLERRALGRWASSCSILFFSLLFSSFASSPVQVGSIET